MKKLYATLFVAALGAGTMCAQTLSTVWTKHYDMNVGEFDPEAPNWSSTDAIKKSAGMHNAIGMNSKLYGIDMRTMSVIAFDANGTSKAFSLPSLSGENINYVKYENAIGSATAPDYYGSLISRDDAGHLLIGHGYNTGASCYTWTVLDPNNGETKRLVAAPAGKELTACLHQEMVTRAIGDVTKEGYLYVGPTSIYWPTIKDFSWAPDYGTVQCGKILSFTGDGTVANTNMSLSFTHCMPLGNWLYNSMVPLYDLEGLKAAMAADPANVTLSQGVWVYSRAVGSCGSASIWNANCGVLTPENNEDLNANLNMGAMQKGSSDLTGFNYSIYQAIDHFTVGGKDYFVAAYSEDSQNQYTGYIRFGIFSADEGYLLSDENENPLMWEYDGEWKDEAYQAGNGYLIAGSMNINAEKVDDDNVNIYVWAQCADSGVFAGMFNFGNGNTGTGVNDVNVEANDAAPVYYNLNGVRVANPANGIFIEKRGSKVTKVIK